MLAGSNTTWTNGARTSGTVCNIAFCPFSKINSFRDRKFYIPYDGIIIIELYIK
jgi:hypothetical protein